MKNLRCKYRTGRSKRHTEINATKDKVTYIYEITVVTECGEFKEKEWEVLVEKQAKDLLEINILELLKGYSLNNLAWIKTEDEAYKYALELYASRIWENKEWLGYDGFNKLLDAGEIVEQISLI
jgi:hypothetical protein